MRDPTITRLESTLPDDVQWDRARRDRSGDLVTRRCHVCHAEVLSRFRLAPPGNS